MDWKVSLRFTEYLEKGVSESPDEMVDPSGDQNADEEGA
jgi:hypothetical protein